MNPVLTFSMPALAENIRRIRQLQPADTCWIPEVRFGLPADCLELILHSTQSPKSDAPRILCSLNVEQALELSNSPAFMLTPPPIHWVLTSPIASRTTADRVTQLARDHRVTVVADHFRHLELASLAAKNSPQPIDVLIEVDTGLHLTGACPGPDTVALAKAIAGLSSISLRGLFTTIRRGSTEPTSDVVSAAAAAAADICRHCQRMIQASQIRCREILLDHVPEHLSAPFTGTGFLNSPLLVTAETAAQTYPPVTLLAEVLSRPSLEYCVISAGSLHLSDPTDSILVVSPKGAAVAELFRDQTVVRLDSESLDLRIGDRVALWSPNLQSMPLPSAPYTMHNVAVTEALQPSVFP